MPSDDGTGEKDAPIAEWPVEQTILVFQVPQFKRAFTWGSRILTSFGTIRRRHGRSTEKADLQMTRLTLELALRVIDGALARATELACAPLTVVVLDAGGHDIALKRQDGSGILRADIARGKAWGALGMGFSSRELGERAQKVPHFFGALASVSQGRLVPVAGGVLIHDEERNVVGAVGISGDTSDRDEDCALCGVTATGLQR